MQSSTVSVNAALGSASRAQQCDIVVIGGGPAGSTISTFLSRRGWNVTLFEKDRHPRFHIGESLLPLNMPIFDRLGVRKEVERIGMFKPGAEFVYGDGEPVQFYFRESVSPDYPFAYQVKRSELDEVLLRNSAAAGTKVFEGVRVNDVQFSDEGAHVTVKDEQGVEQQWFARFVVDASGRDTCFASKLNRKRRNRRHNSAAIFSHFEGAEFRSGADAGLITVYWFDHGWFWMIPFNDGGMSVGAVCWPYYMMSRTKSVDEFFMDTIAMCPGVARRLKNARMTMPALATGNYSYEGGIVGGERFLTVGDAYAFIDPVFSSGVFLAMNGAEMSVELVEKALRVGELSRADLRRQERRLRHGIKVFSWFIYRITTPVMRRMFLKPRSLFNMKAAVLSLLSADLYRGTPIRHSLFVFKVIYYVASLINWRESWQSWRQRRRAWHSRLGFIWKTGKQTLAQ
jgi:flavin-dependent dehydrogenase